MMPSSIEPSRGEPLWKILVSRGVLLAVGLAMLVPGLWLFRQAAIETVGDNYFFLAAAVLSIPGALFTILSLIPRRLREKWFKPRAFSAGDGVERSQADWLARILSLWG